MVSFILRKVYYAAGSGAQEILSKKEMHVTKIVEVEKQIGLAKKIMKSISDKGVVDNAALIRAEAKLRKLEYRLKEARYKASAL